MDYLACAICKLPFHRPKILPCGHFFCTECLQSIVSKKSFTVSDDNLKCLFCPTCKQISEFDCRVGVKAFMTHSFVELLVDLVYMRPTKTCQKCKLKRWKKLNPNLKVKDDELYDILGCCFCCQNLFCKFCKVEHDDSNHSTATVDELKRISIRSLDKQTNFNHIDTFGDNDNHFRTDASQNFEPTFLSTGAQNLTVIANRRGQMKLLNKNFDVIKSFDLLNVQHQVIESNDSFSRCQNYGRISPCYNILIWSIAFDGKDRVAYTVHHRCVDHSNCTSYQLAFIQTVDCQPVGKCTLRLTDTLKKQLDLKLKFFVRPRNILYLNSSLLLISDIGLHCIHMFDSQFNHIRSFGGLKRRTKFKLNEPRCLAKLFKSSSFAVVDCDKIKVFSVNDDMTLTFKLQIVGSRKKFHPYQVACDVDDNFYVLEKYEKEVSVFNSRGQHFMDIVNPHVPFEACDITISSGIGGLVFLYKSKNEKYRWHISPLEWSICRHIIKNTNNCKRQEGWSARWRTDQSTFCSIL